MTKRALWSVMACLALAVAGYATVLFFVPAFRPPFLRTPTLPLALLVHFGGGAVALALGPFQFRASQRARRPALHRWLGRAYVLAIASSGTAGLALAFLSQGGVVAHAGFGLLAAGWLVTTTLAFLSIRQGDTAAHQRWMIRSFSLTLAAVTLRIYLPLAGVLGVPFEVSYPIIAWACWVPNILVAEWRFVPHARRARVPAIA
ncbi:MAG: DUF2306 domain-containing protein [Vicinamibacterales bacterium]